MWCFITFSPAGWYMGRWRLKTFVTSCGLSRATVTYFLPFFSLIYTNFLSHGDIFFALFSPFFSLIHTNFLTNFHQFSGDIFFAFFSHNFSHLFTHFFSLIFPNFSLISSESCHGDIFFALFPFSQSPFYLWEMYYFHFEKCTIFSLRNTQLLCPQAFLRSTPHLTKAPPLFPLCPSLWSSSPRCWPGWWWCWWENCGYRQEKMVEKLLNTFQIFVWYQRKITQFMSFYKSVFCSTDRCSISLSWCIALHPISTTHFLH